MSDRLCNEVKKKADIAQECFNRFDRLTAKENLKTVLSWLKSTSEKIIETKDLKRSPATRRRLDFIISGSMERLRKLERTEA